METTKLPDLMTVQEFADFARVSAATVRRSCQAGKLPCIKVGHNWRIVTAKALETGRK